MTLKKMDQSGDEQIIVKENMSSRGPPGGCLQYVYKPCLQLKQLQVTDYDTFHTGNDVMIDNR